MTLDHAIYKLISSDASLQAVITSMSTQVGSRALGELLPQIRYIRISSPASDDTPQRWERWRFFVRAEKYATVETIKDLLYNVFQNGGGTVTDGAESFDIDFTTAVDFGRSPEVVDDAYESYIDFRITWRV